MATKTKTNQVITVEIELEKSLSHGRRLAVDITWDMADLPLGGDRILIDRADIDLVSGPEKDDVILDLPESLTNFTWQGIYRGAEWMSIQAFAQMVRKDKRVQVVRVLQ